MQKSGLIGTFEVSWGVSRSRLKVGLKGSSGEWKGFGSGKKFN